MQSIHYFDLFHIIYDELKSFHLQIYEIFLSILEKKIKTFICIYLKIECFYDSKKYSNLNIFILN